MTQATQAVLFDLDGVLVHSREVWFRVLQEAVIKFGNGKPSRKEFESTFGQGTLADIESFELNTTVNDLESFYHRAFVRHMDVLAVDPDAHHVLETLIEKKIRRAVVTNTTPPLAKDIIEKAGLSEYIEVLVGAGDAAAKPEPDLLHLALQRLEHSPQDAWMVGDSIYDLEAGKRADVTTIGYGIKGGVHVIKRLSDVLDYV